jgi:hypothetical protein
MTEKESRVFEYPKLTTVNLADLGIQKDLIAEGIAVGIPGGEIMFTRDVKLVATGE